jgi:hypothetical protein
VGDFDPATGGGVWWPRIALYLAAVIERAINGVAEGERAKVGLDPARRLIDLIRDLPLAAEFGVGLAVAAGDVLRSVSGRVARRTPGYHRRGSPIVAGQIVSTSIA